MSKKKTSTPTERGPLPPPKRQRASAHHSGKQPKTATEADHKKPAQRAATPPRRKPTAIERHVQMPLFNLDQGGAQ